MKWGVNRPINYLPDSIREIFIRHAGCLLKELESRRLEVLLIPAPDPKFEGHKIRVAENSNPDWYQELYHSYRHFRRDRSKKALSRIKSLNDGKFIKGRYKYDSIYRELIFNRLTKGYIQDNYDIEPDDECRNFFKKAKLEDLLDTKNN